MTDSVAGSRIVPAVHGRREVTPDPADDLALAEGLRRDHSRAELLVAGVPARSLRRRDEPAKGIL